MISSTHNLRAYYSSSVKEFLAKSNSEILGIIHHNDVSTDTSIQQSNTWEEEITILKDQLQSFDEGRIIFEYTIPRMGKRVDAVLLFQNIVFIIEFKCGDEEYRSSTYEQVYDYTLDLRNFQKQSHDKLLVPIMVSTQAEQVPLIISELDRIIDPIKCNSENIAEAVKMVAGRYNENPFDYLAWENSEYLPTPTIVEAAQALYRGHNVREITRSDAGAENLTVTTDEINKIIEYSKVNKRKAICFVTGVPGAGKTLVGLNIAIQRSDAAKGEHAVFLSGNFPLVTVLQEALARDKVEQSKDHGESLPKTTALREISAVIQIIHKYRDSFVGNDDIPPERIAIFDEAQRAWTHTQIEKFMATKKGIAEFPYSEPEFLISTMDRHKDWCVVICLVGGGQEINTGEAGLPEWFDSLRRAFPHWDIYATEQINDREYLRERTWSELVFGLNINVRKHLHLSSSMRSFRSERVADFVKKLLDNDVDGAKSVYENIKSKYPIYLTRDLDKAKEWVQAVSRGSERYGLFASSSAARLKPRGVVYARDRNSISPENWFLKGKDDIRSSYFLESVASEFETQGLELDYAIVAWDADLRIENGLWKHYQFSTRVSPPNWSPIRSVDNITYLTNAYRVLLTRARQGFIIYLPEGVEDDLTRLPQFYDETYFYLKSVGIEEI